MHQIKIEVGIKPDSPAFSPKEHGLIGISPFNSYFDQQNLLKIFEWALQYFNKISIFLPDEISIHTLCALGYPLSKATRKTKRQDAYLFNKVVRSIKQLVNQHALIEEMIIPLSQLRQNSVYKNCYAECLYNFETNSQFRINCLSASNWILAKYLSTTKISEEARLEAVKYFLAELPLFLNTPTILSVPSSFFVYHSMPSCLKQFFFTNNYLNTYQGFLIANIENNITHLNIAA